MGIENIPAPEALLSRAGFVKHLVRDLVLDDHEAEDVEQEVYLATLRKPTSISGSVEAWLTVVGRRIAAKLHRERGRRTRRERVVARPEATESAAESAARFELHRQLVEFVRRLPEDSRATILMRYFEDLPPKEIAQRLNIPVSTVKSRLQRALARLRVDLDKRHDNNRAAWCAIALPWAIEKGARPAAVGGAAMTGLLLKATIVVALLAFASVGVIFLFADREHSPSRRAASPSASATAPGVVTRQPDETPTNSYPAPVDLDACDRDLDLHGRIVQPDGSPIPGARIETPTSAWIQVSVPDWSRDDDTIAGPSTRSSSDGTFSLRLRWGEPVALRVSAEGFATRWLVPVTAGERVRVVLDKGVRLVATVRFTEPGLNVASLRVRLLETGLAQPRFATTDAAGQVVFDRLTGGRDVRIQPLVSPAVWRIPLPAAGTHTAELTLDTGRVVTGRVIDAETKKPIPGASIGVRHTRWPTTRADAAGRYEISLGAHKWHNGLKASAPGYAPDSAPATAGIPLDFELRRGATTVGRLVDTDGNPVAGARLACVRMPCFRTATISDADGRFELKDLAPAAAHTLIVLAFGYPRTLIDFQPPNDLGELTLPKPGVVEGRVRDVDGTPLARIEVTLSGAGQRRDLFPGGGVPLGVTEVRYSDDLGRFRFPNQPDGIILLRAKKQDGAVASMQLHLSEKTRHARTELRFEATPGYVIRVRDELGRPLPGIRVYVHPWAGGNSVYGKTDVLGETRLALSGRSNAVGVTPPSHYLPQNRMPEEGEREFEFFLQEAAEVHGRVLLDGKPLPHPALVEVRAGDFQSRATIDPGGAFVARVPAKTLVDLRFMDDGKRAGSKFVARFLKGELKGVEPGSGGVVLNLSRIPVDRSLQVRVVTPTGQPLADARVAARPVPEKTPGEFKTNRIGVARLTGLGARPTTLSVRLENDWLFERRWVAPAAKELVPDGREIELKLREATELHGVLVGFPPEARVAVAQAGQTLSQTRPDSDGRFTLLVPRGEPGPFEVRTITPAKTGMVWIQKVDVTDVRKLVRIEKR